MKSLRETNLEIKYIPIEQVKPYQNNPRRHSREQVESIKQSVEVLGNRKPIEIDENGVIICGHGRLEAYKALEMRNIPVVVHADMTEDEKKAYRIADNELALRSEWDEEILKIEIADIDLRLNGIESLERFQIEIETIDNDTKLSGAQYGDTSSKNTVPMNILGIGGMVSRSTIEKIKNILIEMGAIEKQDNSEILQLFFDGCINDI